MRVVGCAVALAILTARAALAVCTPRYESPAFYEGSPAPYVIRVANLNGDEWPDLVVGNREINDAKRGLSWLIGAPEARYGATQLTDTDSSFTSVAVADFDRDRDDDVVAYAFTKREIRIFRNDGGRLIAVRTLPTPGNAALVAGDFNGDARADFAVVGPEGPTILLMLGAGDGVTFTEQRFTIAGGGLTSATAAAADFNRDGRDDLAVARSSDRSVITLFGTPSGIFESPVIHVLDFLAGELLVSDVDGDRSLDLVVTFVNQTPAAMIRNVRAGAQATITKLPATFRTSRDHAAGDFDGDGLDDVMAAELGGFRFFRGNGSTLTATSGWMTFGADATGAWDLVAADLDRDGDLDLAAATIKGVAILRNHGDATFDAPRLVAPPNAVVDFTGDGVPDLLVALAVVAGMGNGIFAPPPPTLEVELAFYRPAVGDLNGDGRLDVVYHSASRDQFGRVLLRRTIALNAGNGTFTRSDVVLERQYGGPPRLADLNRDGKLDLIAAVQFPAGIAVALGRGDGTFEVATETPGGFDDAVPGDFDGDGKLDLLRVVSGSDSSIVLGRGDGTFGEPRTIGRTFGGQDIAVADLDGNGRADIAMSHFRLTGFLIQQNDGSFAYQQIFLGDDFDADYNLVADLNGDSIPDLFVVERTDTTARDGRAMNLFGTGNGAFTSPMEVRTNGVAPIFISDLNGDGRPDLVDAGYPRLNTGCFLRRRSVR